MVGIQIFGRALDYPYRQAGTLCAVALAMVALVLSIRFLTIGWLSANRPGTAIINMASYAALLFGSYYILNVRKKKSQ